jgi:hypothetical protein
VSGDERALEPARQPLRRALRVAGATMLVVASIAYMASALASPAALRDVAWFAHPWLLAASVVLNAIALSLGCVIWWSVLNLVAADVITPAAHWRIWALTNPVRYIPGRIWHVTSLGLLMRSAGVPVVALLTSMAVHMWLFVLAACVVGLGLLPSTPLPTSERVMVVASIVALTAIGTHPRLLGAVVRILARVTRQPMREWRGRWHTALGLCALNVVIHVVTGLAACLVLRATVGLDMADAPRIIAANAVAFLVGYVSLVPAGLGVRDAAMAMLLAPVQSSGRAALAAIVLRAWAIVTELLLVLIAVVTTRRSHDGSQRPVTGA